jgi:hypothetical protein
MLPVEISHIGQALKAETTAIALFVNFSSSLFSWVMGWHFFRPIPILG